MILVLCVRIISGEKRKGLNLESFYEVVKVSVRDIPRQKPEKGF